MAKRRRSRGGVLRAATVGAAVIGAASLGTSTIGLASARSQVEKTAAEKPPSGGWWDGRTFYEIFVRSFADSNGDGIGDLRGATAKLPYLQSLGVGAIWLMPVTEGSAYHGYSVTDYRSVERDYGTLADLKAFIAEAKRLDIKVIVDLVVNHTSDQHPWFLDANKPNSKTRDWYMSRPTDPGTIGPWGQQVWFPRDGRYSFALFDRSQPDLNLTNPAVTHELISIGTWWLREVGVDGFRLDAASHLIEDGARMENTAATLRWWRTFTKAMKQAKPDAFLIGEVNGPARPASNYVPDALDATFNFDLAKSIVQGVVDRDPVKITIEQAAAGQLYGPGQQYGSFLTNHDQQRVRSSLGGLGRERLAAAQLLTRPGIPFVYYGEEVGLAGMKPDERIRTPMPWTADARTGGFTTGTPWQPLDADNVNGFNVAAQERDPNSILSAYRALIGLRKAEKALQAPGTLTIARARVQVIGSDVEGKGALDAYVRQAARSRILVVHHLGTEPLSQFGGEGPVELVVETEQAVGRVGAPLLTIGWPKPPSITASGTRVVVRGPIPPTSTLILRLP
jgi:alpha-amylase